MRRREFVGLVGGAAVWSLGAKAQDAGKVWRIGFLTPRSHPSPPGHDTFSDAFIQA
jgi:hypothetical protein